MGDRRDLLRDVMQATRTSQVALARMSGVRQPSISQFLAGRVPFSDEMLERLLACMGYQLEISRTAEPSRLSRSDRLRWALHRRLATHLDGPALAAWDVHVTSNLERLRSGVRGEPHETNLARWERMIRDRDLGGIRHAMVGLDDDAIAMREVSPLAGILSQAERADVMSELAA